MDYYKLSCGNWKLMLTKKFRITFCYCRKLWCKKEVMGSARRYLALDIKPQKESVIYASPRCMQRAPTIVEIAWMNGMEWNGLIWNGMEWKWNGME